eukprot:UN06928
MTTAVGAEAAPAENNDNVADEDDLLAALGLGDDAQGTTHIVINMSASSIMFMWLLAGFCVFNCGLAYYCFRKQKKNRVSFKESISMV